MISSTEEFKLKMKLAEANNRISKLRDALESIKASKGWPLCAFGCLAVTDSHDIALKALEDDDKFRK